jgi:hypothetical protein
LSETKLFELRAKVDAMGQADVVRAGRQEPFVHAMVAEIAFLSDAAGHVEGDGFVRALVYTGFAPRAPVIVHDNDAVLPLVDRALGTGSRTGRDLAVPADPDVKNEPESATLFSGAVLLHPDKRNAVRGIHFLLARDFAGPAPPAQRMIDVECMLLHSKTPDEICRGGFFSG